MSMKTSRRNASVPTIWKKLYEKAYEWYEEQEGSNMHDYLEETRKNMEADNLAESLKSMKMKSGNLSTTGTIPTR